MFEYKETSTSLDPSIPLVMLTSLSTAGPPAPSSSTTFWKAMAPTTPEAAWPWRELLPAMDPSTTSTPTSRLTSLPSRALLHSISTGPSVVPSAPAELSLLPTTSRPGLLSEWVLDPTTTRLCLLKDIRVADLRPSLCLKRLEALQRLYAILWLNSTSNALRKEQTICMEGWSLGKTEEGNLFWPIGFLSRDLDKCLHRFVWFRHEFIHLFFIPTYIVWCDQ